jgi:GMP reductase
METVIDLKLCKQLDDNNYFYIMHRFQDVFETVRQLNELNCNCVSISIGVNEESYQQLEAVIDNNYKVDIITIDVAHGHHQKVGNMIRYVKKNLPNIIVIAGNVGTYAGFHFLEDAGADVVKVGIGSGVICTTRYKTGFGTPMFSTLLKITSHKIKAKIMADGGCREFGDVAKALVAGADCVMAGSFFAGCVDSPAKIVDGYKEYYGSTSYTQKGNNLNFVEGREIAIDLAPEYNIRLKEIEKALKSSISYAGCKDLSCLSDTKFIQLK